MEMSTLPLEPPGCFWTPEVALPAAHAGVNTRGCPHEARAAWTVTAERAAEPGHRSGVFSPSG